MITTLWLLKPIRQASLLAHLGSQEIPYVRLGSIVVVALVVAIYSRIVDQLTRLQVAQGASLLSSGILVAFWVALTTFGERLSITGERKAEKEERGKCYHRIERSYGPFMRTLALPDNVAEANVKAEYEDGVLQVHLMKSAAPKPKSIDVKVG